MRGQSILVTGAAGLIGRNLCRTLRSTTAEVIEVDIEHHRLSARADIRDSAKMAAALREVSGVVHLAALSRVIAGEQDPELCWDVNVNGTKRIIDLCLASKRKPWFLSASSREVYGQQPTFPVREDAERRPMNVYARSKVAAEDLVTTARHCGLTAAIVRFSNVYGDTEDYRDRVVPAFAWASVRGGIVRTDGRDHRFDFTHVKDVVGGIASLVALLAAGERDLPSIHLTSGIPTTLSELASLAVTRARGSVSLVEGTPRSFDVSHFWGDPSRALQLIGWTAKVDIRSGFNRLADDLEASLARLAPSLADSTEPRTR